MPRFVANIALILSFFFSFCGLIDFVSYDDIGAKRYLALTIFCAAVFSIVTVIDESSRSIRPKKKGSK